MKNRLIIFAFVGLVIFFFVKVNIINIKNLFGISPQQQLIDLVNKSQFSNRCQGGICLKTTIDFEKNCNLVIEKRSWPEKKPDEIKFKQKIIALNKNRYFKIPKLSYSVSGQLTGIAEVIIFKEKYAKTRNERNGWNLNDVEGIIMTDSLDKAEDIIDLLYEICNECSK